MSAALAATGFAGTLSRAVRSRIAWCLLAVAVVVALAFGSVHPPPSSEAARIARLDSVIKCPSCDDLSIAQSEAPTAVALRAVVASDVRAGESDAAIENFVVARYGSDILLQPSNPLVWVIPLVVIAAAAAGVVSVLWRRRRAASGQAGTPAWERTDSLGDDELVTAALGRRSALDDPGTASEDRAGQR